MAAFDPYHKWLGIPAAEQPPTLYRLLGISPFEADLDVIDAAANRQMAYVRGFASGPRAAVAEAILNELSAARLRLLNPRRKMAYDAELRERLNPSTPAPRLDRRKVETPAPTSARTRTEVLPAPVAPIQPEEWLPARAEPSLDDIFMVRRGEGWIARSAPSIRRIAAIVGFGLTLFVAGGLLDRLTRRGDEPPPGAEFRPLPAAVAVAEAEETSRPSPIPDDSAEFQGSRFKVVRERLSWPEAMEKCRLAGGRLACPETAEAQKFLADLKGDGEVVWVGGYRDRSNTWRWVDGREIEARRIGGVEEGFNHVAYTTGNSLNCRTTSGHAPGYAVEWVEGYICEWPANSETEGSAPPFDLTLSEPVGEVRRFTGHTAYVSAAFSPDGRRVVTWSNDKTVRVWEAATGRELWRSTAPKEMLRAAAFAPDGRLVYACDLAGFRVLNAETGAVERSVDVKIWDRGVFSADCSKLLARHPDESMTVYNTEDGSVLYRVMERHTSGGLAFAPDGRRIYYGAGRLTAVDLGSKRIQPMGAWQGSYFETIAASQNGDRLAWGSGRLWNGGRDVVGDRMVRVWDARDERLIAALSGHEGWLWAVAISADGRRVLSGGGGRPDDWYAHKPGADTSIRLWDVDARKLIRKFEGHKNAVLSLAFSPDGKYALSGGADSIARLWRLPGDGDEGRRAERSPVGRYRIVVFDETLGSADPSLSATFSADHEFQASNGSTMTRGTWELDGDRLLVKTRRFGEILFDVSTGQSKLEARVLDTETRRRKRLAMSRIE